MVTLGGRCISTTQRRTWGKNPPRRKELGRKIQNNIFCKVNLDLPMLKVVVSVWAMLSLFGINHVFLPALTRFRYSVSFTASHVVL